MSFEKPITKITSPQNAKIKDVARLRSERHRKKHKKILIDGVREIERAIHSGFQIEELFCCSSHLDSSAATLFDRLPQASTHVFELTEQVFGKISFGQRNEGFVAVAAERRLELNQLELSSNPFLVILDAIEKPGNIGAVFRTAAAAGVEAILLTNEVSHPFNANSVRASLGTVFELPFVSTTFVEVQNFLAARNIQVVTTRVDGPTSYTQFDFSGPSAIVMGSEAEGISPEWYGADSITIPMHRSVDSLNISTSSAIIIFEAHRQRHQLDSI